MKTALATAALFFGLTINLKAQEDIGKIKMGEVGYPIAYPVYQDGGEEGIRRFVEKNLDLSNNKDKGEVTVSYKVDENGLIVKPRIMAGLNPQVDAEILRVIKQLNFSWEKDIDFPPADMDKMIEMERRITFRIKKSNVEVFFDYWQ